MVDASTDKPTSSPEPLAADVAATKDNASGARQTGKVTSAGAHLAAAATIDELLAKEALANLKRTRATTHAENVKSKARIPIPAATLVVKPPQSHAWITPFITLAAAVGISTVLCAGGLAYLYLRPTAAAATSDTELRNIRESVAQLRRTVATLSNDLAANRSRVRTPLRTGVRVVDLFSPLCLGQRIGVFAGSGVGKTTLLAMLAQSSGFDTVVTALVGERGREVREFLEETLVDHKSRAVTVVSTSDESPMMRRLAAKTAMTIAEYFRDRGESVLLIVNSVTRFAHAAREVALAAGEPAIARGYAPSVFSELPRLLERSGPGTEGKVRSPESTPSSSMATITTSRWRTRCAAPSTATSCSTAKSRIRGAIPPSTCCPRCHAWRSTSGRRKSKTSSASCAP